MKLATPSEGPPWLRRFADSIVAGLKQQLSSPLWLWTAATVDLPTTSDLGANKGATAHDLTGNRPTYYDGSAWKQLQPYDATLAALAGLVLAQGDLIYGTGVDTAAVLAKDTNATRYLSNTGASNAPAWAQINLANGVTGRLPYANITQGSARSVLGVTGNAGADVASIQGTADQVLVINTAGTALAFGAVATGGIANDAVTYAKMQNVSATDKVLGRSTAGAGDPEEITFTASARAIAALNLVQGDLVYADGTATVAKLAKNTTAQRVLTNGGTSNNPSWAQVDLTTGVTGILPGANGGTANGFTAFSGPAASTKTFVLPNVNESIACLGQVNAFTNQNNFKGILQNGTNAVRIENSFGAVPSGTGVGVEIGVSGGAGLLQFFDRTGATYAPAALDGSTISLRPAGSAVLVASSTGTVTTGSSNSTGSQLITGTGAQGYATGSGGAITQLTSKATAVTLNKTNGQITMNGAALAASTSVAFTLTNSTIAATDVVNIAIASGATSLAYVIVVQATAAGSCSIVLRNVSAGSLSEAVVINFAVLKAVTS